MSDEMRTGRFTATGMQPLQIDDAPDEAITPASEKTRFLLSQVGSTIKAYLDTMGQLLTGKYAHLKDWVPGYLSEPGNVFAIACRDGVVIRYERRVDKRHIFAGWMDTGLSEVVAVFSQQIVQCYPDKNYVSKIAETGATITLYSTNPTTGERRDLASAKIGFDVVMEPPQHLPLPPSKPYCLLSVRSILEIQVLAELERDGGDVGQPKRFLARSGIHLEVGWECVEIFLDLDPDHWKAENAALWAESDLLAMVVAAQFREAQFDSLDPTAAARTEFAALLQSYKDLLDSNPDREEVLQSFLRDNPILLCPTNIKLWPKLALGAHITDFVFRDAIGDYLLVELERSTLPLFVKSGDPSGYLNHARSQVTDWKRYLEDNLATVQRELGLDGISSNPRSLIIIGRSHELTAENRRKLVTLENENPKTRILTYDDILESAKALAENLFGPLIESAGNTRIYLLKK